MTKSLLITNSNYNTIFKIPVFNRYLVVIYFRALYSNLFFDSILQVGFYNCFNSFGDNMQKSNLKSKFAWPPML